MAAMKFINPHLTSNSFSELALPAELMKALEKMEIVTPTAIQSQAMPAVLAGSNLVAIAQTGSGKTLAYALPTLTLLANNPKARALVLAPSREMAQQIHDVFLALCAELPISVCLAIGGQTGSKQSSQLKKNPRVIVATPGRMNDHLVTNKLLLQNVSVVVIDEADRMLDMGFSPQLKSINATLRGPRQALMFSASFNDGVQSIAQTFMQSECVMLRTSQAEAPVSSLRQKVIFLDRSMKNDQLIAELQSVKGSVIVFTGSQESCEFVTRYVGDNGFNAELIHGNLTQGHRNRVMKEFRSGEAQVLVATDLLARGLDIPNLDYVINFDLPYKSEDFLHRIGRTARAGRSGTAITFIVPSDTRSFEKIEPYLKGAKEVQLDPQFRFVEKSRIFNAQVREPSQRPPAKSFRKK